MTALTFARLQDNAENYRTLVQWLARDKLYGEVPLKRVVFVNQWLKSGRLLVAIADGKLVGACGWTTLSADAASKAIKNRAFPTASELSPEGEEVLMSMIAASRPGVVARLTRKFFEMHKGRLIIFERHASRGSSCDRFGWIDRQGRLAGAAIELTDSAARDSLTA
ncbi:hypothetical protein [Inhella sp.]|uniref:hypothetical protein n=1 Tax=Inhella sp. TaxID=1921806 RepID=UPI0035B16060